MTALQFLGAAKTVTGSKYLVDAPGTRVMVDCGLFQGWKELRKKNWDPPPVDPRSIRAVILTHAHIDHTGYLPKLVREGFSGPIYATPGTAELSAIMLPDSGRLQEEDARLANKKGFSKHDPAKPLYTEREAVASLRLFEKVPYGQTVALSKEASFHFTSAGHILGSSFVELAMRDGGKPFTVLFSGDLGRYDVPILEDPSPIREADYVVVESTYGDRLHDRASVKDQLAAVVGKTAARGGKIVIPAFAVGRTQEVLYYLRELEDERRIPILPVLVDSPMAQQATQRYVRGRADHDREMAALIEKHVNPLATHSFSFGERRPKKQAPGPGIIISASGMATGGRVLNHLAACLPDPLSTILFVGFQAGGTRGRRLLEGDKEIRIHGEMVPVKAEIVAISGLSAHADYQETLRWLGSLRSPPRRIFVTHGEPEAAAALARRLEEKGFAAHVPDLGERVDLSAA
ncbi:MAG: MBL fold metallo-hydrolase [Acidobacteriota bacterium]